MRGGERSNLFGKLIWMVETELRGGHLARVWWQRVCLYLITGVLAKLEGQDRVGIHYYAPLTELAETDKSKVLIDSG